ncbi:MAG: hypothetical protein HQL57_05085 [Magnetococcales bacterium]|nr:hypothetical protein [Magnetococcales bacterium]
MMVWILESNQDQDYKTFSRKNLVTKCHRNRPLPNRRRLADQGFSRMDGIEFGFKEGKGSLPDDCLTETMSVTERHRNRNIARESSEVCMGNEGTAAYNAT